jgi:cell wall-associated NlpC family hydrolase
MELELHDILLAQFSEDGIGPKEYNCWNLCREVYRRCGKILPKYSDYIASISDRGKLIEKIRHNDFVRLSKPEFLALVTFQLRPKWITHIGVMIDNNRFIHVRKKAGVSTERIDIGQWAKKIEGFYRYIGK